MSPRVPGPLPKHPSERRRRNLSPSTVYLPAGGRKGPTPGFPLDGPSAQELEVWKELWQTPQAVMWEKIGFGCNHAVARYARILIQAENGIARASLLAEVRHLERTLGLDPVSMARLRWEIVPDEDLDGPSPVADDLQRLRKRVVARQAGSQ